MGNDEDWEAVCRNKDLLVCPESGCDLPLVKVERPSNPNTPPRFFRFKSRVRDCGHWKPLGGGGPESREHDWVKNRIVRIVRHLGYRAIAEHWVTKADVYVEGVSYCLEVQLRATDFETRTNQRNERDAEVCWLVREGVDRGGVKKWLFGPDSRGVRFRVNDGTAQKNPAKPWEQQTNRELNERARIEVFGTVGRLLVARPGSVRSATRDKWFEPRPMSAYTFLKQILVGERRWHSANEVGHRYGLWVLETDLAEYQESLRKLDSGLQQTVEEREPQQMRLTSPSHQIEKAAPLESNSGPTEVTDRPAVNEAESDAESGATSAALQQKEQQAMESVKPRQPPEVAPRRRRWWQFWRRA